MKKIIVSIVALFPLCAFSADLGLGAQSLKLKVYKFAVSTSPLCTNLRTIISNGNTPTEVDFKNAPNLGSGSIPEGTYHCVVIEFSDYIKFKPDANSDSNNCQLGTEETLEVCRAGGGSTSQLIDGSTTTCINGEDRVAMYLSTGALATGGSVDAFNAPTSIGDIDTGFNLANPLVVTGTAAGKFVVNPAGKVCDGDDAGCDGGGDPGQCRMEPPTFNFTQL